MNTDVYTLFVCATANTISEENMTNTRTNSKYVSKSFIYNTVAVKAKKRKQ